MEDYARITALEADVLALSDLVATLLDRVDGQDVTISDLEDKVSTLEQEKEELEKEIEMIYQDMAGEDI